MTMGKSIEKQLKAVANGHRLNILEWLRQPERNFPPQVHFPLSDGVCALLIEEKLGLSQPTTAQHLKALVDAGLVTTKRQGKWTYYRRSEPDIAALKAAIGEI